MFTAYSYSSYLFTENESWALQSLESLGPNLSTDNSEYTKAQLTNTASLSLFINTIIIILIFKINNSL